MSVNKSIYDLSELTLNADDEKEYERLSEWDFMKFVSDEIKRIVTIGANPTLNEFRYFDTDFIQLIDYHARLDLIERLQLNTGKYPPVVEKFLFSIIRDLVPRNSIGTYLKEGGRGFVLAYNEYRETALKFPYSITSIIVMFQNVRLHESKHFYEYREEILDIMYISTMPNSPRVPDEIII
ncbi:unnamed protein product [[Candida] boidinii]|nr:unnamed protein product [[Candida] boidinii]